MGLVSRLLAVALRQKTHSRLLRSVQNTTRNWLTDLGLYKASFFRGTAPPVPLERLVGALLHATSVRISFPTKTDTKLAPEARPGDRKHY